VPINSVDLYPTLLQLAGAKPPAGQPLNGLSYASLLIGGGKQELARDAPFLFCCHVHNYYAALAARLHLTT
jgi:arylsulfatase A-like enzyme